MNEFYKTIQKVVDNHNGEGAAEAVREALLNKFELETPLEECEHLIKVAGEYKKWTAGELV